MSDSRCIGYLPNANQPTHLLVHSELRRRVDSLGILPRAALKAGTVKAYTEAVEAFHEWAHTFFPAAVYPADLNTVLLQHITCMYDENPRRGARHRAVNTLRGVEYFDARLARSLQRGL